MNDSKPKSKPIWASKTLWINFLAIVAAVAGAFGLDLGLDPDTQMAAVVGIMGVVNIILRFMTKTPVGV